MNIGTGTRVKTTSLWNKDETSYGRVVGVKSGGISINWPNGLVYTVNEPGFYVEPGETDTWYGNHFDKPGALLVVVPEDEKVAQEPDPMVVVDGETITVNNNYVTVVITGNKVTITNKEN